MTTTAIRQSRFQAISFLFSCVLVSLSIAACGGQKSQGKLVDNSGAGSGVDKPKTSGAVLDAVYSVGLTAPVPSSGVQSALSNLLYTPNSGLRELRVTHLGFKSSCDKGYAFYFTWSVLAADGSVLDEIASPIRAIESGHQYLLRVYPARLEKNCAVTISYNASGDGTVSPDASLLWPKVSYFSYQRFVVGTVWQPNSTLMLEVPDGIPDSGDLKMRLNVITTRPNGERSSDAVFNTDGSTEKLTITNGKIMAACTQLGNAKSVQVGTISGSSIAIEKKILFNTGECKETARLFRFNRGNHGLIDFSVLNNIGQPIRAVMAPIMGQSNNP